MTGSTVYSYTVQAIDAAGNGSAQSAVASATTQTAAGTGTGTATLAWDAATATNFVGYRIYYGAAPGTYLQARGQGLPVGKVTTSTLSALTRGTRYYFAVTIYDATGAESVYSNEVFKDVP